MDPTNRNTALASAMTEELARCGLRHAVLSPGSRSTPLALALWREPAIEASVIVDERSAGFFALGGAQATRTPVAVLCTSGTAAANLHPAVCEADQSGVPLIILTADRPAELRDIGAGQTIDQLKLYGAAVRWFCDVGTHAADDPGLLHFRSVACRAFALAAGDSAPGPVHLNVPWREPLGPAPRPGDVTATSKLALEGRGNRPLTEVATGPPAPDGDLLERLAGPIRLASSGLILAGRQTDPALREAVVALADARDYPILAEPTSQLRFGPHDRGSIICAYDAVARSEPARLDPALVIRFGEMPTSKALRGWLESRPQLHQIVVQAAGWNEPSRRADTIVRADATATAAALAGLFAGGGGHWRADWRRADRAAREAILAASAAEDEPTEPGFWLALADALADGDLVYTASSMPIRDQESYLGTGDADVLFLANRGANGIDGLISSGIGAAHASGRPAIIVTGDLGLLHDLGGLAALRGVEAPVRIVVLDNGGGGIFEFLPQAGQLERSEFEALLGTPRAPDAGKVAALFDLPYQRLQELTALPAALEAGTGLIHVRFERSRNVAVHRRLDNAAASAIADAVS